MVLAGVSLVGALVIKNVAWFRDKLYLCVR